MKIQIDRLFGYFGFLIGLTILFIFPFISIHNSIKYISYGFALFIASLTYLYLGKYLIFKKYVYGSSKIILYFIVLFSLSLLSINAIFIIFQYFARSLYYFILMTFVGILLALQIFLKSKKLVSKYILFQILIYALILRASMFYFFPSIVGIDPFLHVSFADSILRNGYIDPIGPYEYLEPAGYTYFPFFHLIIAIASQISSLGLKNSIFFTVGIYEIVSIVFVYFIGKFFISTRVGLISALMISVANTNIQWGYWIIPMTYGFSMILLNLWIILSKRFKTIPWMFISILSWISIISAHTLSAFIQLVIISTFIISDIFTRMICKYRTSINMRLSTYALIYSNILFLYWAHISLFLIHISRSIESIFIQFKIHQVWTGFEPTWPKDIMMYFFSFIGILILSSNKYRNVESLRLVFGSCVITILAFLFRTLNISPIIPERWLSYSQVLLSVPAGVGFVSIASLLKTSRKTSVLVSIMALLCIFPMITSIEASFDSPFLGKYQKYRFALLSSEVIEGKALVNFYNGMIKTDSFYYLYFKYNFNIKVNMIKLTEIQNRFINSKGLLLIRTCLYEGSAWFATSDEVGITKIEKSLLEDLNTNPRANRIASFSSVIAYNIKAPKL